MTGMYKPVGDGNIKTVNKRLAQPGTYKREKRECVRITISGEDYLACKHAKFSSSEKTGDAYGKRKPFPCGTGDLKVATGLFGEMAIAILYDLEVDLSYRKYGDDYDFLINGETWDVKVATKLYDRPNITAFRYGKKKDIMDKYIVCLMENHDYERHSVDITVIGYINGEDISHDDVFNAVYPGTKNFNVYFSQSNLMEELT